MIAPHPIVVTGADGVVRFCNSFAAELFGYSEEEMTGLEFASLVCLTNNGEAVSSDNTDAEDNALVPDTHLATETTAHRKNSEVLPVELGSSEFELDAEKIIIHFIRDISFRKRSKQRIMELQRELMHLSRQNVLGELASAITHELNQPLTAITNYATAARRCGCTASPESLEASFALMEKAECQAQRARQIVHKLRSLVAHHEVECAEHDLRTVLEEAVQLASLGAAEYGIDVFIDPHQDVWSRWTGGDGAPAWTMEAVGMDITKLDEVGAAIVHNVHTGPYPHMIWDTNNYKFGTCTMFTLF
ncbi:MAG: PAS domain S-box protein, partial [Alphaproteobacteria bacterium]